MTLDDYAHWLQRVLDGAAGSLVHPPYLNFLDTDVWVDLSDNEVRGFSLEDHRLEMIGYSEAVRLDFNLDVIETRNRHGEVTDLEVLSYGYHLSTSSLPTVWRYDRHEDHHGVGEWHRHDLDGSVMGTDEVHLEEILTLISCEPQLEPMKFGEYVRAPPAEAGGARLSRGTDPSEG